MPPFSGTLIDGRQGADWLRSALTHTDSAVSLCSAYLRADALRYLLANRARPLNGQVLVRWRLNDLLAGASDLDAYLVAKDSGLQLLVHLDFHGKVFAVPGQGILVGSANATVAGFGLGSQANEEVCTLVQATDENLGHVTGLLAGATLVEDSLFEEIRAALIKNSTEPPLPNSLAWPEALMAKMEVQRDIGHILVSECFWSTPSFNQDGNAEISDRHDRDLLALQDESPTVEQLRLTFRRTKLFRWLCQYLHSVGGEASFGALSMAMHDNLLDEPKIYRRDVKALLQNLISWCQCFGTSDIIVERPAHSQIIRLANGLGPSAKNSVQYAAAQRRTGRDPRRQVKSVTWRR